MGHTCSEQPIKYRATKYKASTIPPSKHSSSLLISDKTFFYFCFISGKVIRTLWGAGIKLSSAKCKANSLTVVLQPFIYFRFFFNLRHTDGDDNSGDPMSLAGLNPGQPRARQKASWLYNFIDPWSETFKTYDRWCLETPFLQALTQTAGGALLWKRWTVGMGWCSKTWQVKQKYFSGIK